MTAVTEFALNDRTTSNHITTNPPYHKLAPPNQHPHFYIHVLLLHEQAVNSFMIQASPASLNSDEQRFESW